MLDNDLHRYLAETLEPDPQKACGKTSELGMWGVKLKADFKFVPRVCCADANAAMSLIDNMHREGWMLKASDNGNSWTVGWKRLDDSLPLPRDNDLLGVYTATTFPRTVARSAFKALEYRDSILDVEKNTPSEQYKISSAVIRERNRWRRRVKDIWRATLLKDKTPAEILDLIQHKILGFGSMGHRGKGRQYSNERILYPEDFEVSDFEEVIKGYRNIMVEEEPTQRSSKGEENANGQSSGTDPGT